MHTKRSDPSLQHFAADYRQYSAAEIEVMNAQGISKDVSELWEGTSCICQEVIIGLVLTVLRLIWWVGPGPRAAVTSAKCFNSEFGFWQWQAVQWDSASSTIGLLEIELREDLNIFFNHVIIDTTQGKLPSFRHYCVLWNLRYATDGRGWMSTIVLWRSLADTGKFVRVQKNLLLNELLNP